MRTRALRTAAFGIAAAALVVVTGCAASTSGSRTTLYDSIDALARDSSIIIVGTVSDQRIDGDATVSAIEVTNTPVNPQLGGNLDGVEASTAVGEVVEVRQMSDPLLAVGEEYLLFATPTMLPGDAASQFYITGAVAGLYARDGAEFRRVAVDSGDTIPATISIAGSEDG